MFKRNLWVLVLCAGLGFTATRSALAIPVTDAGAIAQLITQIDYWKQQIQGMTDQLTQLKSSYDSMTGTRGMERLLSGTVRNYLPPDWQQLEAALRGLQGSNAVLSNKLNAAIRSNAVLTADQIALLSDQEREQLESGRKSAALLQVTSQQALESSSARFASLQQLIDAIPSASDPKAVLDLQARIAAEQAMLQNEQTKMMLLYHATQAEEMARQQRAQELAVANIGSLRKLPAMGLNQ